MYLWFSKFANRLIQNNWNKIQIWSFLVLSYLYGFFHIFNSSVCFIIKRTFFDHDGFSNNFNVKSFLGEFSIEQVNENNKHDVEIWEHTQGKVDSYVYCCLLAELTELVIFQLSIMINVTFLSKLLNTRVTQLI